MGIADELLALADHLATPARAVPEQAWLRRSVSTAYYALFHLLVQEAAQGWSGSPAARLGLERTFRHDNMKEVSRIVSTGAWKGWGTPQLPAPPELRAFAKTFIGLQDARHQADYNNAKSWTSTEVNATLTEAQTAFQSWGKVRASPAANEYLLSLMVGKKRE